MNAARFLPMALTVTLFAGCVRDSEVVTTAPESGPTVLHEDSRVVAQRASDVPLANSDAMERCTTVVFPTDSETMDVYWTAAKTEETSVAHQLDQLLLRRYCTYVVDTQDMLEEQVAKKTLGWAVYPAVMRGNDVPFPVWLAVDIGQNVSPHPNYPAEVNREPGRTQLAWEANEPRVPSHFGYVASETQEAVRGVEVRRGCTPLGNGRARITVAVRAGMPLLIRVWGLKGRVEVQPESIEPKDHRLSDNGVLFFDYGRAPGTLGQEWLCSFVVSGLGEGELFYPMTNAMRYVRMRGQGCPSERMTRLHSAAWGFDFTLKSERPFTVRSLERWTNEEYRLEALHLRP